MNDGTSSLKKTIKILFLFCSIMSRKIDDHSNKHRSLCTTQNVPPSIFLCFINVALYPVVDFILFSKVPFCFVLGIIPHFFLLPWTFRFVTFSYVLFGILYLNSYVYYYLYFSQEKIISNSYLFKVQCDIEKHRINDVCKVTFFFLECKFCRTNGRKSSGPMSKKRYFTHK